MVKKSSAGFVKAYRSVTESGRARTRCAQTAYPSFRFLLPLSLTAFTKSHKGNSFYYSLYNIETNIIIIEKATHSYK